jgi:hypothetical protein
MPHDGFISRNMFPVLLYIDIDNDFEKIYFHLKTKRNLNRARWILSIP